jgi:hypothetical protein
MGELSVLVRDHHAAVKTECLLQPVKRGPGFPIEHGGDYAGATERIIHGVHAYSFIGYVG